MEALLWYTRCLSDYRDYLLQTTAQLDGVAVSEVQKQKQTNPKCNSFIFFLQRNSYYLLVETNDSTSM